MIRFLVGDLGVRNGLAGQAVVEEVRFVLLDDDLRRVFARAAGRLGAA